MARDIAAAGRSHHDQLGAGVVDRVTLDGNYSTVRVWNRDGVAEIFFTVDGADPVASADGTFMLPAAMSTRQEGSPAAAGTVVKLVSSGVPKYSVEGG